MNIRHFGRSPTWIALAICVGAAQAQTPPMPPASAPAGAEVAPRAQPGRGTRNLPSGQDDAVHRGDRNFVRKAAGAGLFEVEVSQLAASRAADPRLQSFASMLVNHHTAANDELVQLANRKGIELAPAPPRALRREIAQLDRKKGADFDRAFLRKVGIEAHEKDIRLFEKASRDLKDAQLKAFVDKTLPTLRAHLAEAQRLAQAEKLAQEANSRSAAREKGP